MKVQSVFYFIQLQNVEYETIMILSLYRNIFLVPFVCAPKYLYLCYDTLLDKFYVVNIYKESQNSFRFRELFAPVLENSAGLGAIASRILPLSTKELYRIAYLWDFVPKLPTTKFQIFRALVCPN